jgi:RNA polymerase sigma factor (sigma-70 family)
MTSFEFNSRLIGMKPNLQKFALSLTTDRDNAKDLVQDTFLKAISNRDKFAEYTNLEAWVYTIMKNTFINNYRRSVRVNSSRELNYFDPFQDKGYVSPESAYNEAEINRAIDSMRKEFRVPFRMHINGFKYQEIADELELKIGTVKSRIFFSRRKLMRMLKDYPG